MLSIILRNQVPPVAIPYAVVNHIYSIDKRNIAQTHVWCNCCEHRCKMMRMVRVASMLHNMPYYVNLLRLLYNVVYSRVKFSLVYPL